MLNKMIDPLTLCEDEAKEFDQNVIKKSARLIITDGPTPSKSFRLQPWFYLLHLRSKTGKDHHQSIVRN